MVMMEEDEPIGEFHSGESEPDQKKSGTPRLYIKELMMRNFKSYASEQHIGSFHKSFSAVVEPNGSGKSNVIDAMLFVFGKKAKQGVKDEVETYMLKELSHFKWQEKATNMAYEDTLAKITEQKESLQSLENNLKNER